MFTGSLTVLAAVGRTGTSSVLMVEMAVTTSEGITTGHMSVQAIVAPHPRLLEPAEVPEPVELFLLTSLLPDLMILKLCKMSLTLNWKEKVAITPLLARSY